jgi:hypothetical protein
MYLIVDKDNKKKFKIVKNYLNYKFGKKDKFEIYCGKPGPNKGKKVAKKLESKNTIDTLIEEG